MAKAKTVSENFVESCIMGGMTRAQVEKNFAEGIWIRGTGFGSKSAGKLQDSIENAANHLDVFALLSADNAKKAAKVASLLSQILAVMNGKENGKENGENGEEKSA